MVIAYRRYGITVLTTTLLCLVGCDNRCLKCAPPQAEICGEWVIDLEHTYWPPAAPLLQGEQQAGCLEIRSDGTFSFRDMPEFSHLFTSAPTFHHNGTGKWQTKTSFEGTAYLWLDIEEMDGQRRSLVTDYADFWRGTGGHKCLLAFTIGEPDYHVLVLKRKNAEKSKG